MRDLSDTIPQERLVSTENLTTIITVVPKGIQAEWRTCYESLADFVVPRSSFQVAEDSDYVAFAVVLFRRAVDDFKASARARGFQAKDVATAMFVNHEDEDHGVDGGQQGVAVNGEGAQEGGAAVARMRGDVETKRAALVQWCAASYGEAFSSWIHITAVRLFVESILRYGLPPQFLPVLMHPQGKHQAAVRKLLATHFGAIGGQHFTAESSGGAGGEDLFPYVSFTLNIEESS